MKITLEEDSMEPYCPYITSLYDGTGQWDSNKPLIQDDRPNRPLAPTLPLMKLALWGFRMHRVRSFVKTSLRPSSRWQNNAPIPRLSTGQGYQYLAS